MSPLLEYRIWEDAPSLYTRACDMLAKLGDRRAVPVLVLAVEDHFRHGSLDSCDTATGAAHLVVAINELTGENIGGLKAGSPWRETELQACDWTAIRKKLAVKLGNH